MHLADASGDAAAKVTAMAGLAIAIVFSGRAGPDGTDVRPLFEGGADLAEEIGDWWLLALAAGFAGASLGSFDPDGGEALMQRGIAAARRSGSPYTIGAVSMAQGRMLGRQGKTDAAVAAFGVAIERFMELGDERFVLASRSDMAHALRRGGRLAEALAVYRETIAGWVHLGHKGAVANQLENFAYLDMERGRTELAVRLLGAADALREAADAQMAFDEEPEYIASLDRLRAALMTDGVRERLGDRSRAVPGRRRRPRSRRLTPTMASQLLDTLPVPLVFVAFAIVTMICYEVGFRLGRWWQVRTPGEQEGPTGMLVGSILALLAFLLAVTMGMAADRFDARRALVLAEANAIGTAYLRAGYLPEPASSQARELLRQYVPLRIVTDADDLQADIDQSNAILAKLWTVTEGVAKTRRLRRRRDLCRIGQRDDRYPREAGSRRASTRECPETVILLLIVGAALSLGMVGYSAGLTGRRSLLSAVVLVIALGAVIMIVVDLDRPREGFIQVSQQPLLDLQQQIGPPSS